MTAIRVVLVFAADVLGRIFVGPVREGRLRTAAWPTGLRSIVALALAAYVAAAVLLLATPVLRRHGTLRSGIGSEVVYPSWSLPVLLALTALTLALLHAATLHLTLWLRVSGLVVVAIVLSSLPIEPWSVDHTPQIAAWTGTGLLVLLTAVRWRARFAWWEFVASFLVVGVTTAIVVRLVARSFAETGQDPSAVELALSLETVVALAIPFTVVAGLAFAQLALLLAHRASEVVDQRVRRTWPIGVLVAAVAAADLVLLVRRLPGPTTSGASRLVESGSGLLVLLLGVGAGLAVLRRAEVDARVDASVDALDGAVGLLGLPVALALTFTELPSNLAARLHRQLADVAGHDPLRLATVSDWLARGDVVAWLRLLAALALVGWALRRRDPRVLPAVLAATTGVVVATAELASVSGQRIRVPSTPDSVNDAAVVLAVLALVALVATRRLDRGRLVALGGVLGIALAWSVRTTFDAPFVAVFGLGATAAVFLGTIWTTLTDAEEANDDSRRYPRPARVLLFAANAVLTMTALAFLAATRAGQVGVDLSGFGALGDLLLGTGLVLAAYAVLAWRAARPLRSARLSAGDVDHPADPELVGALPEPVAPGRLVEG